MSSSDVFIVGGARTPMTGFVGALKDVSAIELGAIAARGAFEKTGVKPGWVDHVIIGNVAADQRRRGSTARATWRSKPAYPLKCPRSPSTDCAAPASRRRSPARS